MRILVTGASGFIGSSLAPVLEARGHEVRAPVRAAPLERGFAACDALVHLANIAHARAPRALLWKVNVDGTRRVAELAVKHRVRRLVYLSSIKAREARDHYGRAKLAAEAALAEVAAASRLEVVVLRPPLVYGARVRANFLALMRAIARGLPLPFAGIDNRRSLVYVGNLCDAIAACLESGAAAGRTYEVSDGTPISTPALCRAIGAALGRPARLFRFPSRWIPVERLTGSLVVDDAAIRRELGWRPPFTFEQGLHATADWLKSA